ncbi:MAG: hypothetical protein JST38_09490 [Bacteroidetes bacterium]|nr:hypothetical protein [Pseudomonadota bacterium]MBS1941097.1 hypothetical protein [Bacteroidota bacterium]
MKQGPVTYKYGKYRRNGGRYGTVTIEIIQNEQGPIVTDACEYATLKEAYPNFVEFGIIKLWKRNAIIAATELVQNFSIPKSIELIIRDVSGLYVDTCPSHIGAAMTIGVFDYCDIPLYQTDLDRIDEFVEANNEGKTIPDYSKLDLSTRTKIQ